MKKVGILTLPIKSNYGGILQAYALLTFLKNNGYDAWFIKRHWDNTNHSISHKIIKFIYHKIIIRKFNTFINKYIYPQTPIIDTQEKMKQISHQQFDAFIVGSDQIWRMKYTKGVGYNYFLDFCETESQKRIAYAASFGVDYWDDPTPNTSIPIVKKLLQNFNAISVREDSGVTLCKSIFNVDALHVIDPTLLLNKEEYLHNLCINIYPKKYLGVYILDLTNEKKEIIQTLSQSLSLPIKYLNESSNILKPLIPQPINELIKPGVKNWIKGIAEAEFILTDSFHGTAFSIIFEKQFLAIGNIERGLTRFQSLLKMLNIENHLITSLDECKSLYLAPIDYKELKELKEKHKNKAVNFLKESLQ